MKTSCASILVFALGTGWSEIMLKTLAFVIRHWAFIFLPLVTTNCVELGVAILMIKEFNLLQASLIRGYGAGFALGGTATLRRHPRARVEDVAQGFQGVPIALITASILAMAFMGFSGLV